jgi:histone-lysine N-methyltransferase SETMAR
MQGICNDSLCPKKFQTAPHAGKHMASAFWDMEGTLLIKWLPQGQTINNGFYCNTLRVLVAESSYGAKEHRHVRSVLHDNARPHSSKQTTKTLAFPGYTILPHPPYSPYMAPLDYALLNNITERHHSRRYPTSDDMERGSVGTLSLTGSYHREGNSAQTLVGGMSKVLPCDLSPVINWRLVTQLTVNPL